MVGELCHGCSAYFGGIERLTGTVIGAVILGLNKFHVAWPSSLHENASLMLTRCQGVW
jgi:branched-subunit amino acid ABC-type transport system permease component